MQEQAPQRKIGMDFVNCYQDGERANAYATLELPILTTWPFAICQGLSLSRSPAREPWTLVAALADPRGFCASSGCR